MLALVENDTISQGSTALMSSEFDNLISLPSRGNVTSINLALSLPKVLLRLLKQGSPPSCRGSADKPLSPANTVVCYSGDTREGCEEAFPGPNGVSQQSGCLRRRHRVSLLSSTRQGQHVVSDTLPVKCRTRQNKVPLASVLSLSDAQCSWT